MSPRVYYAVIADAIASRGLPPARRAALQTAVRAAARELTRRHRRAVAAGDEPAALGAAAGREEQGERESAPLGDAGAGHGSLGWVLLAGECSDRSWADQLRGGL